MPLSFDVICRKCNTGFRHARQTLVILLVGTFVLTATVTPVSAAAVPLTLAEAQRQAVTRSRQLIAHESAATAAQQMAVAAGQLSDPVLSVGVQNVPISGSERFSLSGESMTMRSIGVMQQLDRSDKRRFRAERYEREADRNLAERKATVAAIQRDTALAWLELYYAEAAAKLLREQHEQARMEVQAAEGAYRGGRANQADVFAARSALVMLEDRSSELQRRVASARIMLARWIGGAADMPLAARPALDTVRLDFATLDTQLAHHPQIAVLNSEEEIAAAEARLAQANKKADWTVEVMYSQRGSAHSDMVSVGVNIPLQLNQRHRQDRELSSKLAMVEQARAERDELLRAHVAETRAMMNEWQNGRDRIARYETELLPLASQQATAATAAYRGGKASLADVLMARRNETDVRLQVLQIEAETARLWAQLNYLFPDDATATIPAMTNRNTQ